MILNLKYSNSNTLGGRQRQANDLTHDSSSAEVVPTRYGFSCASALALVLSETSELRVSRV